MQRQEALELVKQNIKKENLIKHMLAVEAIMRGIAKHLSEDEEFWGLVGLLHDIDFDVTYNQPERHALVAEDILKGKVDDKIIHTIKTHNFENTGVAPESKIENALIATDSISGLIVACALVMPSKKLADVRVETIKSKFKQKDFARNCPRKRILFCEKIGLTKEEFFEISLKALQQINEELGL